MNTCKKNIIKQTLCSIVFFFGLIETLQAQYTLTNAYDDVYKNKNYNYQILGDLSNIVFTDWIPGEYVTIVSTNGTNVDVRWTDDDGYGYGWFVVEITDYDDNIYYADATVGIISTNTFVLSDENYIHTIAPRIASTNVTTLADNEKIETVSYFDGLGRNIQTVGIRAGGNSEDIITHINYDNLGRQSKSYLPYTSTDYPGSYRDNALTNINAFYNTTKYENTTNPYSETLFDGTPLNIIVEQAAPGNDWKEGNTTEHTIKNEYELVETSDNVIMFQSGLDQNGDLPDNGHFQEGEFTVQGAYNTPYLYKFITKNENWVPSDVNDNTTHTFKDYRGRVILSRTFDNQVPHDTYYIYDIYGNLVFVIPPKVDTSNGVSASELSELCFQYKYDDKNRLIEKKIPGKGWEYIVYNKLDQPVLTQHATQLATSNLSLSINQWSFTKYDRFGRVAYTGLMNSNSSRITLQGILDGTSSTYVTKGGATTIAGTTIYYNNGAYPTSIAEIHTINYYDDYTFDKPSSTNLPSSYEGQTIVNYNNTDKPKTKGLATGSKVRVLTTNHWITTVTGYDVKGRPIYTASDNPYLGSVDVVKSKLDFIGVVDKTETSHDRGTTSIDTEELFTYDHIGRLKKHTQELNNSNVVEVIMENTYDELGQLTAKSVGGKSTENRLQHIDYTYNVRGWLKQINDPNALGSDLFGFKLNYNTTDTGSGAIALYNGNISETIWKTANDVASNPSTFNRAYSYVYDDLNRITDAFYKVKGTSGSYGALNWGNYELKDVTYDKNGNILTLVRTGNYYNAKIDDLVYEYNSGNKLMKVSDSGTTHNNLKDQGFKDGFTGTIEFSYDANGNMIKDYNRSIWSNISYNHLNLPKQIIQGSGNISYIYDAIGTKLSKTISTTGTITYYAGNYQYEGSSLKFFGHPEGYIEPNGNNWEYFYQYTDHLGNIRLSYKDVNRNNGSASSLQIQEENNYYPFGLKHQGYNNTHIGRDHKFGFGGKEEQDDDVYGMQLNWLDFHARNYDAALGRWMNLDPLADSELQFNQSPYAYTWNNPVNLTDPTGMHPDGILDDYGIDKNGNIVLIKKTDDKFDRLYRAKSDENGNATKDENGNAEKEIEGEGTENKDYVKVNKSSTKSTTVISDLSINGQKGEKNKDVNFAQTGNKEDAFKVFQFAAENSKVEWSLQSHTLEGNNTYVFGTYHQDTRSPNFTNKAFGLGLNNSNINYDIHSHVYTFGPSRGNPSDMSQKSTKTRYRYIYYAGNKRGKGTLFQYGSIYGRKSNNRGIHKIGDLYKSKYFKD